MSAVAEPPAPQDTPLRSTAAWVRVRVELFIWRHGWVWVVLLALLGAAIVVQVALLQPLQLRRQAVQEDLRRLAAQQPGRLAEARLGRAPEPAAPGLAALDVLDRTLRPHIEATAQVRRVYRIAARQGLAIGQASFQHSAEPQAGIDHLQISLPLNAGYPQVRRFVEEVLRELPNASVDQLSLKRNQVGQAQLEARLRLSIWLTPGDPPKAGVPGAVVTAAETRGRAP